jgi:hypothetical protein
MLMLQGTESVFFDCEHCWYCLIVFNSFRLGSQNRRGFSRVQSGCSVSCVFLTITLTTYYRLCFSAF